MTLLTFVACVLVAVLLERQARKHALELSIEYEKVGIPVPRRRPKLKRTEAWLNVGLGLILIGISAGSVMMCLQMRGMVERIPGHAGDFSLIVQYAAFYLASGVALAWLGWRAIREITRYESGAAPSVHRPGRFTLTTAVAAGAFFAGILTGYLFLSREAPTAATPVSYQATVLLEIHAGDGAGIPPGLAQELEQRFASDLGSIPGVRVVRTEGADFRFRAELGRNDGSVVITWNVVRSHDNAPYITRTYTIPVAAPASPLRIMMSSLSSAFGEKRTTAEFEQILRLPENSLD